MNQYNYGWLADSRAGLASAADSSKAVIDTKGDLSADWIGKSTDQMFHAADLMARPAREKAFNEELMKVNKREQQNLLELENQFIKTAFEDGKKDLMDIQSLETTGFTYDDAVANITKRVREHGFDNPTQLMYALTAPNAKFNPALSKVRDDYKLMANLESLKLIERKRDALDSGAISSQDMMMIEESMRSRSPYGYEQGVKGFINEQMQASSNIMQNAKSRMDNSYQMMANADVNHKEFYGNNPDGSDEMMPTTSRRRTSTDISMSSAMPTNNPATIDTQIPVQTANEAKQVIMDKYKVDPSSNGFNSSIVDSGWIFGLGADSVLDNDFIGETFNSNIPPEARANTLFKGINRDRLKYILNESESVKGGVDHNNNLGIVSKDISNLMEKTFNGDIANATPESIKQFAAGLDEIQKKGIIRSKEFGKVKDGLIKDITGLAAMNEYNNHPAILSNNKELQALAEFDQKSPYVQSILNNKDKIAADKIDLQTNVAPLALKIEGKSPTASRKNEAFIVANMLSRLQINKETKEKMGKKILDLIQEEKGDEGAIQSDFVNNIGGKIANIGEKLHDWAKKNDIDLGQGLAGPNNTNVDINMLLTQILASMVATYDYDKKSDKLKFNRDKAVVTQIGSNGVPEDYIPNTLAWVYMTRVATDPSLHAANFTTSFKAVQQGK